MQLAQQLVKHWMVQAGQDCPDSPEIPSVQTCILRTELIAEEWQELQDAFGIKMNNMSGDWETTANGPDVVGIADAIGDLLYVVLGTAVACGIQIEDIFSEIHRSNMTKFIDGHCRQDGKWMKGPSYTPAQLEPILDEQSK